MDDHVLKLIHKRFHELDRDNSGYLDKEDFLNAPLAKDINLHSSTVTPILDMVLLRNEASPTEFNLTESEPTAPSRAYSSSIHDPAHMKHTSDPPVEEELSPRPKYHASKSLDLTFHSLEGNRRKSIEIKGVPLQVDGDIEHLRHSQGGLQSLPPPGDPEEEAVSPLMKLFGRRGSKRVVFDDETIAALAEAHQRRNDSDASALDSSHGSKASESSMTR